MRISWFTVCRKESFNLLTHYQSLHWSMLALWDLGHQHYCFCFTFISTSLAQCTKMSSLDLIRNHKIWLSLVFVRFCLVFLPQQGYIHPDEFFQSTEIVAGIIVVTEIMGECRIVITGECRIIIAGECWIVITGECLFVITGECHIVITGKCLIVITGECRIVITG